MSVVVVYKKNKSSNKSYMNVYVNEKNADKIITSSLRNPLLPDNYIIEEIGIGNSFIESYKKKYKLKSHKTI